MSSPEAPPETAAGAGDDGGPGAVVGASWSRAGGPRNLRSLDEALRALEDPDTTVWVDLEDASSEELARLAGPLGLHPLVVEDIIDRDQRAKVEYTGDVHLVMFAAIPGRDLPELAEIDIVLTPRCLVTSHPSTWRPLDHGVPAVAGIFGMSEAVNAFDLREGSGFWLVTGLVHMVGVVITRYFRRIDWV